MGLTRLSTPAVTTALEAMVKLGIIKELTGKQRNKMYGYTYYLKMLSAGTE